MTDPRPEPKYGQYAPVSTATPAAAAPPTPAPSPSPSPSPSPEPAGAPPVAQRNRTRDVVITTVLLLIGVVDVVSAFSTFADLGSSLTLVYHQLGITGSASAALAAPYGLGINVARISVLALTVLASLLLISRHRRAFWVPLVGYLVAGIASSILVLIVMLNDPAYIAWVTQQQ